MHFFEYLYEKIIVDWYATLLGTTFFAFSLTFSFLKVEKNKKSVFRFLGCFLLTWAIEMTYSALYDTLFYGSDIGYTVTPVFLAVTAVLIFRDEPLIDRVVRACMLVCTQAYVTPIFFPITNWEMSTGVFGKAYLITDLLKGGTLISVVWLTKKCSVGKIESFNGYFLGLMFAISGIGYLMNALAVAFSETELMRNPFSFSFFMGIGFLVMQILAYVMFYKLIVEYDEKRIIAAEEQRSKSELKMIKNFEISYNRLREIRHDISNQYSYVSALLSNGEVERAKDYLKSIGENLSGAVTKSFCDNNIVNVALNMAYERAERSGISLETKIAVPERTAIPDMILGSVLTNLFNNAIDSCKGMKESSKTISVYISCNDNYLLIRTVNPVDEKKIKIRQGKLVTSKRDKNLHGIGTKIIERLAKEQGGCFAFKIVGEEFIADVMMKAF